MTQSDIYRLLLTVLLFANRQLSSLNAPSDAGGQTCNYSGGTTDSVSSDRTSSSSSGEFSFSGINDLMILVMFVSLFSPDGGTTSGTTF